LTRGFGSCPDPQDPTAPPRPTPSHSSGNQTEVRAKLIKVRAKSWYGDPSYPFELCPFLQPEVPESENHPEREPDQALSVLRSRAASHPAFAASLETL
jgi:hypothetical protein